MMHNAIKVIFDLLVRVVFSCLFRFVSSCCILVLAAGGKRKTFVLPIGWGLIRDTVRVRQPTRKQQKILFSTPGLVFGIYL